MNALWQIGDSNEQRVNAIRHYECTPGTVFGFGARAEGASRQIGYTSLFFMASKVPGERG